MKISNLRENFFTYKHKSLMVFDYEDLLVIEVLFDLNLKEFWIWVI